MQPIDSVSVGQGNGHYFVNHLKGTSVGRLSFMNINLEIGQCAFYRLHTTVEGGER